MADMTAGRSASPEAIDYADMRKRVKAIFIGSIGNLVEWYDFYVSHRLRADLAPGLHPDARHEDRVGDGKA